jgi:1,4-dihydroxy-6-naphthoate synthase
MKKHFDASIAKKVNQLITESLAFARGEYPNLPAYVQQHAQEMDPGIMRQHIDLYVNAYSEGLGPAGEEAVLQLWRASGQLTQSEDDIFWR